MEEYDNDTTLQIELTPEAITPTRGSTEAAGYDLYSSESLIIQAKSHAKVSTGIKLKLPIGTYSRVAPWSGLSLKRINVAAGVIDLDHTEEIQVVLVNTCNFDFVVTTGDRIAQFILEHIANVDLEIVNSVGTSDRSDKGFGSTRK